MAIQLVTLAQVKEHLRIDQDLDDNDLTSKLEQASAMILAAISSNRAKVVSDDGLLVDGEPLQRVQAVTLRLVGILSRNREGEDEKELKRGELPWSVTSFLGDLYDAYTIM
ncbi:head-tail connector protein [Escherichia albertii]|uniref:head-tail connector protein n=1 Tax=Escherichia albertii TaxID=208962 RepID=UPI0017CC53EA|nr:head-tail connector protein [Escherichia albertii]MCI5275800.1 phage gp6-like head-tail connector protein [Escherichia albertii]MCZ8661446.1 head-tail connector protein [Escherichia albertii]MCZ9009746.1 head-tail connector protein [Escherichia albertii]HCZ5333296.1 phage gp6-like head-tail connector protein [Escherichia albertii]